MVNSGRSILRNGCDLGTSLIKEWMGNTKFYTNYCSFYLSGCDHNYSYRGTGLLYITRLGNC